MKSIAIVLLLGLGVVPREASAADKLVGIYAARVMSQSSPWIAQEAGRGQEETGQADGEMGYLKVGAA